MTPKIRLAAWAQPALDAYDADTFEGGEPVYPQLAADALEVLAENSRMKQMVAATMLDVAKIETENAADKRDAERYRNVRKYPAMLLHLSNRDFDSAIDSAIAKEKEACKN